jgi:hypothetical protein
MTQHGNKAIKMGFFSSDKGVWWSAREIINANVKMGWWRRMIWKTMIKME